jgi:hypothetical protein
MYAVRKRRSSQEGPWAPSYDYSPLRGRRDKYAVSPTAETKSSHSSFKRTYTASNTPQHIASNVEASRLPHEGSKGSAIATRRHPSYRIREAMVQRLQREGTQVAAFLKPRLSGYGVKILRLAPATLVNSSQMRQCGDRQTRIHQIRPPNQAEGNTVETTRLPHWGSGYPSIMP